MSPYNFNEMCEINSLHVTLNIIFLSNDSLGRIRIWGDIWWYHRLISAWPICESHRTHVLDRISVPHLSVTCLFILWTTEKQAVDVIKTQTLFCVVGILLLISSAVDSVYPLPTTLTDESYSVSFNFSMCFIVQSVFQGDDGEVDVKIVCNMQLLRGRLW